MHSRLHASNAAVVFTLCFAAPLLGTDDVVHFSRDVAPLLERHCLRCHNDAKPEGDLSLTTAAALLESGVIDQADLQASQMLVAITASAGERPQMPKDGAPLTSSQTDVLRRWIAQGAVWPEKMRLPRAWSLAPLSAAQAPVPEEDDAWCRSPIDRFVLARLDEAGLSPAGPAARRHLARRLYVTMLGLQPSPEVVAAFVDDQRPDAWERLVDRVLSYPEYGERWAQHWLDVARFSESDGFENDAPRPHAWPYRDYVIRSLNADKPYDQFVREQIAGDVSEPVTRDAIIATGFLVAGPYDIAAAVSASPVEKLRAREVQLAEMLGTVTQTFLALTANCARCHDHKFDPIPQADYYRLKAVFEGVDQSNGNPRVASPIMTPAERETYSRERQAVKARLQRATAKLRSVRSQRAALDDRTNLPPLNTATALWQFNNSDERQAADLKGGESSVRAQGTARFGLSLETPIRARNSDQRVFDTGASVITANRDDGAGYSILPSLVVGQPTGELLPREQSSVTVFARVRKRGTFNGTDDIVRVGDRGSQDRDSYALEFVEAAEGQSARAQFVITGHGQPDETIVAFPMPLRRDHWYDLTGVFESLSDGRGRLTLHVADPNTGQQIASPVSAEVPYDSLESGGNQNLLFFVAPSFRNGANAGTQLDLAAVWHEALTSSQVRALSANEAPPPPSDAERQRLAARRKSLDEQIEQLQPHVDQAKTELQRLDEASLKSFIGVRRQPPPTVIFTRGNVQTPAAEVVPAGLSAIAEPSADLTLPDDASEGQRRVEFARWLTHPRHPLTARVIVNRVWHHHFGVGIVDTPSDFGVNGGQPSHPDLLDWLARQHIADGWSLKQLHRRILLTATWRQAATFNAAAARVDAENRLLWRYAPRRLDAETVRDVMLQVSGQLNTRMGGPSFQPFNVTQFNTYFYELFDKDEPQFNRRTIYRMKVNTGRDPLLDALDCPAPSVLTPRRRDTVTPLQALALMNDTFVLRQATRLAKQIGDKYPDTEQQIERAWRTVLCREPSSGELKQATQVLQDADLTTVCWVLFNSSEFLQLR